VQAEYTVYIDGRDHTVYLSADVATFSTFSTLKVSSTGDKIEKTSAIVGSGYHSHTILGEHGNTQAIISLYAGL
jgi:hypothetical protein